MRTNLLLAAIFISGLCARDAAAQTVDVTTDAELRDAIAFVHPGATIAFQADITLTSDLPAIQRDLTVEGNGHTLSGNHAFRGFFVYLGRVTIRNLTIQNASARGGYGGDGDDNVVGAGGGGGAGLGGALFVATGASVTIDDVRLLTNEGRGGNGGIVTNTPGLGSGGGGGLGGHGSPLGGGGGGIGVGANGGAGDFTPFAGGPGIVIGVPGGGTGTDDFWPGAPGGANAGGGGGGRASGGGGIGGADAVDLQAGWGGFGGGGGGTIDGSGGAGGFGGGGGGVAWAGAAGAGGFGGGGGGGRTGGWTLGGSGGFGGGAGAGGADSSQGGVGGGGAGMGGAIFVMHGGTLIANGTLTINGNTVAAGTASGAAQKGRAFGSGLFLHGDGEVVFKPAAGALQVVGDAIADLTGSGGAGPDAGSWTILKDGPGTLQLAGTNSFTGGVIVYNGAIRIAPGPSPIGSGRLTLHGGVVQTTTADTFTNAITLGTLGAGGGVFDVSAEDWTLAGTISGQGGLTVLGGNHLALIANNSYTGGTTVRDAATLRITSDLNLGALGERLTLDGGTLWTEGPIGSSRPITIGEQGGTITTNTFSTILDGDVDGPGAFIKRGPSTLSLHGVSTRTGSLRVADGRLRVGHETLLWPMAPVAVHAAGVLDLVGLSRPAIGSLSGAGAVVLGDASTLTIGGDGASTTFSGAIQGTGSIAKIGAGTLSLTGVSSYSGGTTIDGGAIAIADDAALGHASGVLNLGGGTLSALGAFVTTRPIVLSATGGSIDTGTSSGSGHAFEIGLSGPIAGAGALRTIGSGIVTLAHAANSYTGGTSVMAGTLRLGASDVIPDHGTVTVAAGAILDLAGQHDTIGALDGSGAIVLASGLRVSGGASTTFAGTIAGDGDLFRSGTGTLTLSGISAFTGETTIESGAMNVTGSLASSAFVMTGGTLGVAGTLGPVTMSDGTLAGNGTIGAVTMSGGTLASAGTTGVVTMSGGTLAATGTIGGLTMSGGTLSPGGSDPARLIVSGDAALNAGGTFVVTVNGATPGQGGGSSSGAGHDQVVVNGGVALQNAVLQVAVNVTPAPDTPLVILDNDGADPIAGTFAGLPEGAILTIGSNGDVRFRISYVGGSGNDVVLERAAADVEPLTWYLAEGATGEFFDFDLLLANPRNEPVPVTIEFLTESGATITRTHTLPATSRTTISVDEIAGLEAAAVSTVVTSATGVPIVVERTMRWDASGYGAHTEKATAGASPTWYFAEGSQGFFSTYFLLVNPHDSANTAHVTWLRQGEPALVREYPLGPRARVTIDAGLDPELIDRAFGATIEFDRPAMSERAMYFGRDPLFSGGHEAAGATSPSTHWFLAEGATGSYFTTYILLANPNEMEANATLTYLPASGIPVVREHGIPPKQRVTINIALEDTSLTSAAVATRVTSTLPLVVERAQYWPNPTWNEAHNSIGVTETATKWGLAEGRVGGPNGYQTYILLANSEARAAAVTLTFLRADGTTLVKTFDVPPTSRFNVGVTGPDGDVPELADESFGALIESTEPIVVERSMYTNANGVTWAAGTNATATRLP